MQVIGLCRFSYPAEGGFQVEHPSPADRAAYLYAPARMEERFRTFEAFTLPSLLAQTDPDFTFLVVIGEDLPAPWRPRLEALLAGLPQAVLMPRPPGPHRRVMQSAFNAVRRAGAACLQFRLDDDDAVARGFVESLRAAARDCAGLLARERHVAFDFNQGFVARPGAAGIEAARVQEPFWTPALGMALAPGVPLSIMNFGHMKLPRAMPCVSFTGEDMFIRGHNDHNDSRQKKGVKRFALSPLDTAGEAHFRDTFGVDAAAVRRLYS